MKQFTPRLPSKNEAVNAAMARLRQAPRAKAAALAETEPEPTKSKTRVLATPARKEGDAPWTAQEAKDELRRLGIYRSM